MSDNPFATPQSASLGRGPTSSGKAPGALTALLIISLILGILGSLGSCVGLGALAFQGQIQEMQMKNAPPQQAKFQKKIGELQNKHMIPNIVLAILNMVIAPMLAIGAIGGLKRADWTPKILGLGLLLAAIYVFVRSIVGVFMQLSMKGAMDEMLQDMLAQQGNQGAGVADTVMAVGLYGGIALTVVIALAMIGFYLWGWSYLRKPEIQQCFGNA